MGIKLCLLVGPQPFHHSLPFRLPTENTSYIAPPPLPSQLIPRIDSTYQYVHTIYH
jgi:hypothetical protein